MNRTALRALCATSVVAGAFAAPAVAATPESGTVSAETPRVDWQGEVVNSFIMWFAMLAETDAGQPGGTPCTADAGCDTFALKVDASADLTIGADGPTAPPGDPDAVGIRITKPDGSTVSTFGDANKGKPLTVKFTAAPVGDYVVDYANSWTDTSDYRAFAELAIAAPAPPDPAPGQDTGNPPPPPSPTPAPTTTQQGGPPQGGPLPPPMLVQGEPAQNIDLTIKPAKASARKLRKSRKLKATVTVSREVAKLTGFLRKGKKTLGKSKRGRTAGKVRVTLKLSKKAARRLKKGTLRLTFVADDGRGTKASKTVKVRVRR